MVKVDFDPNFKKTFFKIKNIADKEKIKKQIKKIIKNPEIGKPMRFSRKGAREVYIGSYRLSYAYFEAKIIFLDLYPKDFQ